MTTPIIWTLLAACSGSEENNLVDDVYQAHTTGEDFVSTEELRQLTENPNYQSQSEFKQIHAFAKYLADDDLSEPESQNLIHLGVRKEDLEKYNWHHAWTRSAIARWDGYDVPKLGVDKPDDEAGARIFKMMQKQVDLSTLTWDKKLKLAEKIEANVMAQYKHKPKSAAEAIRLYAKIEPDLKPIPRSITQILRTQDSLNGKEEMVSAIEFWATQTKNTVVVKELLDTVFEMKMAGVESIVTISDPAFSQRTIITSYKNILRVLAFAAKPEDVSKILESLDPEFYPVIAGVFAEKEDAKDFAKAWSEIQNPETMPTELKAVYDSEVYNEKIEAKKALILEDKAQLESLLSQSSGSEFALGLAALNFILRDDQNAYSVEELRFLKDKILTSDQSKVMAEVKILLTLKPDLIGGKDYFLLAVALSTEDIASHEFKDEIIQSVKVNSTKKAFDLLVGWILAGQFEVTWDEVYEKAVQTEKYTNETLLTDLTSEKPLSQPYWQKLADEDVKASIRILLTSKNESEQKALAQIMLSSENSESYRSLAPKLKLSKEVKDLFLDPLAELRGKVPETILETLVSIKAGQFTMGSPNGIGNDDEHPRHEVEITQNFYAGQYEVTNAIWKEVMGTNPSERFGSEFTGENHPVVNVSWNDANDFIKKINSKLPKNSRWEFRLPTEAEWEYMARAGSQAAYSWGDDANQICEYGNTGTNRCNDGYDKTVPVGTYKPNAYEMYDMNGNVWEWTSDVYDSGYYAHSASQDPKNEQGGSNRVIRGGSWHNNDDGARSANRSDRSPGRTSNSVGFRLALAPRTS